MDRRATWTDSPESRSAPNALLPLFAVLVFTLLVAPLLRRAAHPGPNAEPPTVLLAP